MDTSITSSLHIRSVGSKSIDDACMDCTDMTSHRPRSTQPAAKRQPASRSPVHAMLTDPHTLIHSLTQTDKMAGKAPWMSSI
mmetsp:Transcript_54057/g.135954  ORF Transcript_54057/g.135954 Transcript_54057/m.135954 type:complete len:82 (-) Transcript_54057:1081-1326(-)